MLDLLRLVYQVDPLQILLIDDSPFNIQSANKAKFLTHQVNSQTALTVNDLKEISPFFN